MSDAAQDRSHKKRDLKFALEKNLQCPKAHSLDQAALALKLKY